MQSRTGKKGRCEAPLPERFDREDEEDAAPGAAGAAGAAGVAGRTGETPEALIELLPEVLERVPERLPLVLLESAAPLPLLAVVVEAEADGSEAACTGALVLSTRSLYSNSRLTIAHTSARVV